MKLEPITMDFSICKLLDISGIDLSCRLCFLGITDEEISLVCPSERVPDHVLERSDGWKGFRIQGTLDFSLIGILSNISALLAEEKIGIFVVSTYNTDYVFVKAEQFEEALNTLSAAGYELIR